MKKIFLLSSITLLLLSCEKDDILPQNSQQQNNRTQNVKKEFVTIGDRVWTTENSKLSFYRDGSPIGEAKNDLEWKTASMNKKGIWCWYKFDSVRYSGYGKIYNWFVVADPRGFGQIVWNVPSNKEWARLYISSGLLVSKLIDTTKSSWSLGENPKVVPDNSTGFSAIHAGARNIDSFGDNTYSNLGNSTWWWTSDRGYDLKQRSIKDTPYKEIMGGVAVLTNKISANYPYGHFNPDRESTGGYHQATNGYSIRFIKDL
jgi:uncharacterized protein (TIGR02145 family)